MNGAKPIPAIHATTKGNFDTRLFANTTHNPSYASLTNHFRIRSTNT